MLPSAVSIDVVNYNLSGPNAFATSGEIPVGDSGSSFSATLDSIPVGIGYTIVLDATESDGITECTGSASFDIAGDVVSTVSVRLQCPGKRTMGDAGSVMIRGEVNICAVVESVSATKSEDGKTFSLRGLGSDQDHGPAELTYAWTASGGILSSASGSDVVLSCPVSGGTVGVKLAVSDSDCGAAKTVSVVCDPAASGCATVSDAGSDGSSGSDSESQAVAYQINAAHTGSQPNDVLRLPLMPRWTHDFAAGAISYPLVAGGRVFVTVANRDDYGSSLVALDSASGSVAWGPVALGGSYFWSNAAYENGRVFAVNFDGLMTAFDAATGHQLWVVELPGQYAFSSAPTAFGGRVYVGGAGGGGTLYAVDAATGAVLWTAEVANGDDSSPAVSELGVFVSYACDQAYGFSLECGTPLWHYSTDCEGGGGETVALIDGFVYTRDSAGDLVLDAHTGDLAGTFSSSVIPAASEHVFYTLTDGVLSARAQGASTPSWTFGDGTLVTAPIVVGPYVVVGSSSGVVSAVSVADGSLASSHTLPNAIAGADEQNVSSPLTGLAAAGNQLYVPAGGTLTAY